MGSLDSGGVADDDEYAAGALVGFVHVLNMWLQLSNRRGRRRGKKCSSSQTLRRISPKVGERMEELCGPNLCRFGGLRLNGSAIMPRIEYYAINREGVVAFAQNSQIIIFMGCFMCC